MLSITTAYAQMFPDKVGQLVLDGLEFVVDGRKPWQWGTTSLDNVTAAFEDGFIRECVLAGSSQCDLASGHPANIDDVDQQQQALSDRLYGLFDSIRQRPVPGVSKFGPGIVVYERAVSWLYDCLYNPGSWTHLASALESLEKGNATLVLEALGKQGGWTFDPEAKHAVNQFPGHYHNENLATLELTPMVICVGVYPTSQVQARLR